MNENDYPLPARQLPPFAFLLIRPWFFFLSPGTVENDNLSGRWSDIFT
jgi:hypothetical protein